ncbi:hypothetical protein TNCT_89521 [Trichonephila clavata]|uniref:Uncharacterized protein n=1 Tax=Trichonephila clavata TaxID=2740835 RepID=A0A8X6FPF6_TRICU|nr:hypothetical protein TNCT_89521 [Trichonephila clavata]
MGMNPCYPCPPPHQKKRNSISKQNLTKPVFVCHKHAYPIRNQKIKNDNCVKVDDLGDPKKLAVFKASIHQRKKKKKIYVRCILKKNIKKRSPNMRKESLASAARNISSRCPRTGVEEKTPWGRTKGSHYGKWLSH